MSIFPFRVWDFSFIMWSGSG